MSGSVVCLEEGAGRAEMVEMKWSRGCCDSPIMKDGDDQMDGGPCVVNVRRDYCEMGLMEPSHGDHRCESGRDS